jgi:uncharacterized membrane protein YciS (DUF1049 family)
MDKIQKILVTAGRKDLAQEYFKKYCSKLIKKSNYPQGEEKVNNRQQSSPRELALADVRVYFNDQKLLNLWENELSGQFSDGAWENTPSASWLWKDIAIARGSKNEIVVSADYLIKKRNFNFNQLLSIPEIQQRMIVGNGFNNLNELKSAINIIKQMIANPRVDSSIRGESVKEQQKVQQEKKNRIDTWFDSQKIFVKDNYGNIEYKIPGKNYINLRVLSVSNDGIVTITFYSKSKISVHQNDVGDVVKLLTELSSKAKGIHFE